MASSVVRSVVRGLGALVAVGLSVAAVLLVVFGHDSRSVRVGVILGAWGLLIGFGIFGPRRPTNPTLEALQSGPGTALEVRGAGAARRDFEASLQALLRREVQRTMHDELSGLHGEVAELRGEVRDALRNQVSLERVETRIVGANLTSLQDDLERRLAGEAGAAARLPAPVAPMADITQEIPPVRASHDETEVYADARRSLGRPGRASNSPSSIAIPSTPPAPPWSPAPPQPAPIGASAQPASPNFPMPAPVGGPRPPVARAELLASFAPPPPTTFVPPPAPPRSNTPAPLPPRMPESTVAQPSDLRSLRRSEPATNGGGNAAAAQFFSGAARTPLPVTPEPPSRPAPATEPAAGSDQVEPIRWPWLDDTPEPQSSRTFEPARPMPAPSVPTRPPREPAMPQNTGQPAQPESFDDADPFAGLPRLTPATELDLPELLPDLPPPPPPVQQPAPVPAPPPGTQPQPVNAGRHATTPADGDELYVGRRRR